MVVWIDGNISCRSSGFLTLRQFPGNTCSILPTTSAANLSMEADRSMSGDISIPAALDFSHKR
jgi:hypothetical protein